MPYGVHCLTVRPSAWVSTWLPRLLRLAFWLRALRQWRFLPGPASTLPVAVILNRFLTDDLVFILGISISFRLRLPVRQPDDAASRRGRACPSRPGHANRGGDIAAKAASGKHDRNRFGSSGEIRVFGWSGVAHAGAGGGPALHRRPLVSAGAD